MIKEYINPDRSQWAEILQRPVMSVDEALDKVRPILSAVKAEGDKAIADLTERFDGIRPDTLEVPTEEIEAAEKALSEPLKAAIKQAKLNIEGFHRSQEEVPKVVETMAGVRCWRRSVPIEKVGLYIPGGTAPLFSSVLMLAIPAQIAGCREIILCTPPDKNGKVHPAILFCAQLCGVTRVFRAGGAQAIAAMAFGTETISAVDKIFGPGNQYVTAAKQLLASEGLAIDMPAGPSEVAILADGSANPRFVAADLLAQAEHGVDSQTILVTTEQGLSAKVQKALEDQLPRLPRSEIARQAMEHSRIIFVDDLQTALDLINAYAPEHLILSVADDSALIEKIQHAGSVFLGHYTPESVGDYASGTNHTLPTNGFARAWSGVSLDSFVKKITFQRLNREGLRRLGPLVEEMAQAEELEAHKQAVTLRLQEMGDN